MFFQLETHGYAKTESTISGAILHVGNLVVLPPPITIEQRLFQLNQMPVQMTFVPGGDYRLAAWARPTDMRVRLDDFFIDRYEVSNRNYREFRRESRPVNRTLCHQYKRLSR